MPLVSTRWHWVQVSKDLLRLAMCYDIFLLADAALESSQKSGAEGEGGRGSVSSLGGWLSNVPDHVADLHLGVTARQPVIGE